MAQAMVAELTELFERLVVDLPAGRAAFRVRHSELQWRDDNQH
jgi:hypothetical protein